MNGVNKRLYGKARHVCGSPGRPGYREQQAVDVEMRQVLGKEKEERVW